ncbi:MAG: carboxypeptidase regulatory-like domain-containing protein, partial [Phycisphaerae bacterium]
NDFYMVVARPAGSNFHVVGRRWSGSGWLAEESVQNGLADTFIVDPSVSCGPTGEMYCTFEYWGSGKPQQYYTIKAAPPSGPRGTIAGTVRDQYGAGVSGVLIVVPNTGSTLSIAGGTYSLVVPVGTYSLSASKNNFDGDTRSNVVVSENQTVTVNFVITGRAPAPVSEFMVTPSAAANRLTWWNPSSTGFTGTMVRYKMTGYPTSPSDGVLLVDRPGLPSERASFDHTGLTNGVLYYYTIFAYFEDASRYYAGGVSALGRPGASVDFDNDGDVDMNDFGLLQLCFNGPNRPPAMPASCGATDTDADGDTDLTDFARFQACFNGPNRPPACL